MTLVLTIADCLLPLTIHCGVASNKDNSPNSGAKDTDQVLILYVLEGNLRTYFYRRDSPTQTLALYPANNDAPNSTETSHFQF